MQRNADNPLDARFSELHNRFFGKTVGSAGRALDPDQYIATAIAAGRRILLPRISVFLDETSMFHTFKEYLS